MGLFLFQYLEPSPRKRILATNAFESFDCLLTVPGSSEGWLLPKKGKVGAKVDPHSVTENGAQGPWDIQGAQPGTKDAGTKDRGGLKASDRNIQAMSTHSAGLRRWDMPQAWLKWGAWHIGRGQRVRDEAPGEAE